MSVGSMEPIDGIERVDPEFISDELTTLRQFLDYHRATLLMKCVGLSDDQLAHRAQPPSRMSLLGLLRHLTDVERGWIPVHLDGQDIDPLYYGPADPDGDFDTLDSAPVAEVRRAYEAMVTESNRVLDTFTSGDDLQRGSRGRPRTVRWVLVHLIEEYARHNGHADLLREAIDGRTGE